MTLTSKINWSGREVGGTILGEPVEAEDGTFTWDGSGTPNGEILADGSIVTAVLGDVVAPDLAPATIPLTKPEKDAGVKKLRRATAEDDAEGATVALDAKDKEVSLDEVHPERGARKQAKEEARAAAEAARAAEAEAAEAARAAEREANRAARAAARAEADGLKAAQDAEAAKAGQKAAFEANQAELAAAGMITDGIVAEDEPTT